MIIVGNKSEGDTQAQIDALPEGDDYQLLMTIEMMDKLEDRPYSVYCWDYYLWAHNGATNYDWRRYVTVLNGADKIFVPSQAQQRRLKELLGLDSIVVHSGFTSFEGEVSDEGFVFDPVRYYPEENKGWAEKAGERLGIPVVHSEHRLSKEEYQRMIRTCTFLTSHFREASTGGLSLLEGLYHGKTSLIADSPYQGASDYVGKFATTFKYDDFDDYCERMLRLWEERPTVDRALARTHLKEYTYEKMMNTICKNL